MHNDSEKTKREWLRFVAKGNEHDRIGFHHHSGDTLLDSIQGGVNMFSGHFIDRAVFLSVVGFILALLASPFIAYFYREGIPSWLQ